MKTAWWLLLALRLAAQSPCILQGTVTDGTTGKPLAGVKVFAHPVSDDPLPAYLRRTDARGRFCFERLAPGAYHVIAQRAGYLDQSYGARPGERQGAFIVNADSPVENADIKLVPRPILAGTVLHADGQPADHIEVTVLERVHTSHGPDEDSIESGQTDDRGVFRFADLAPGTYYLSAQPVPYEHFSFEFLNNLGQPANEKEGLTYFPAAAGFASARPIVLKAGQEVSGLTITLRNSALRHLSGRVNGGTGGMTVALDPQSEGLLYKSILVKPDGSFESSDVLPGKYNLELRGAARDGVVATREVDLTGGNLEGMVLAPQETFTVPLALKTEGDAPPVRPGQFRIMLVAVTSGVGSMAQSTAGGDPEFRHVLPGTYRLGVTPRGAPYYLKRVILSGEAQPPERLDLRDRPNGPMELVFSPNVAKIEGRTSEVPAGGVTILLVESGRPEDDSDERRTWSDRNGAFHFDGVKPGKYRLFAIEGFDEGPWGSPELAAALHSATVEVGEKETRQVTVPLVRLAEWNVAVEHFGQ